MTGMARKVAKEYWDGERYCTSSFTEWTFDVRFLESPKTGKVVDPVILGRFLDRKGITEISCADALQMFSDEIETPEYVAKRDAAEQKSHAIQDQWRDEERAERISR